MWFTIQADPLIKIVEMVVEGIPNHERKGAVVRLAASGDRVQVKSGKTVAECEAALWEDGQCTLLWEELP